MVVVKRKWKIINIEGTLNDSSNLGDDNEREREGGRGKGGLNEKSSTSQGDYYHASKINVET
jgi:hypothetical protein